MSAALAMHALQADAMTANELASHRLATATALEMSGPALYSPNPSVPHALAAELAAVAAAGAFPLAVIGSLEVDESMEGWVGLNR